MAEFPTYEEMGRRVAEKALDEILYQGKSIREWMKIIIEQEPCEDAISRQAVLDIVNNPLNIRLDKIIKDLPSVKPQEPKWDRLYSWLNDMRLGIASDETVTDIDERNERIAQTDILDEIMEWMLKQEPQEREDKE